MAAVAEYVRRAAGNKFRYFSDKEEMIDDAESCAWELYQKYPDADIKTITTYALRNVYRGRFKESQWSITHPKHNSKRAVFMDVPRTTEVNDVQEWLETLCPKMKAVAVLFANGYKNHEIAELMGVPAQAVSKARNALKLSWDVYCGNAEPKQSGKAWYHE